MKQAEFKKWLVENGQGEATASSRVSSAKRVEQFLGDLDELFDRENPESILGRFAYSTEDERAGRPNPSPVPIDGDLRTGLASLQQALKLYHSFLAERTNMPDKAEHQALVDRLTRKEIDAAMRDCDQLGLQAFLARGGFANPQVWVNGEGQDQSYPAKATVAFALGHLADGRALTAKEFFNGFGEAQAFAKLEALGYQIIRNAAKGEDDAFSRGRIEGAMDAFDQFRTSGAHADVFSSFGEPKDFWVRSTRSRQDRRFPTKPIVGYLLGKAASTFSGGWSQPEGAAARLHAAGYIIVDQHDTPLPLPDQHTYLMRGVERARLVALNYFIEPAREARLPSVTIRAGDLHDMCVLVQNWANVCQALEGEKFQKLASVPAPTRTGPERSTTTEYTFALTQDGAAKEKIMPHAVQTKATNLILYGPPGTGKTYETAWEAVRLCLGEDVAAGLSGKEKRADLMAKYRCLMAKDRIAFVTFHQSMSYEEFVEGLRPRIPDADGTSAGPLLERVDGVFKRMADRARGGATQQKLEDRLKLEGRSVYKMSLGARYRPDEAFVFEDAVKENCIILGFYGIDFSDEEFAKSAEIEQAAQERFQSGTGIEPSKAATTMIDLFRNTIKKDDIIIVGNGNVRVRGIARVTGEYEFRPREGNTDYCHRRSVEWLWTSTDGIGVSELYEGQFIQRTLYELDPLRLKIPALERFMNTQRGSGKTNPEAYVLIIDEINRANISKVFGELITLLESDKRLGQTNEIQLILPYSKKRFGVPSNLHIIGTMNTADRSIALLDTALRRRFTFRELMPSPEILSENVEGINLRKLLATINDRIEYLFDREHQIGHAYFTSCKSRKAVEDVMRHKVIPLLSEYFYEDWSKVAAVLGDGPQGPSRFLEAHRLAAPLGIAADDFSGERLRWRVKKDFDFSEFTA